MFGGKDKEVIKQKTKVQIREGQSSGPQGEIIIKQKRKVKYRGSSSSSNEKNRKLGTGGETTGEKVVGTTAYSTTGSTAYDSTGLNTGLTSPGSDLTGGHMHTTSNQTTQKQGFVQKIKNKLHGHHNQ